MICEYCNTYISTERLLYIHQTSSKKCIKKQKESGLIPNIKSFKCEYCDKELTRNKSLQNHLLICKKNPNITKNLSPTNITININSNNSNNNSNNNNTNNNSNNNNININYVNFKDDIKKCIDNFDGEDFNKGAKGIAECVIRNLLSNGKKLKYEVLDSSRNKIKYTDQNGNVIVDLHLRNIIDYLIEGGINNKINSIYQNRYNNTIESEYETGLDTNEIMDKNIDRIFSCKKFGENSDFVKEIVLCRIPKEKNSNKNYDNHELDIPFQKKTFEQPSIPKNINDIDIINLSQEKIEKCLNNYNHIEYIINGIKGLVECIFENLLYKDNQKLFVPIYKKIITYTEESEPDEPEDKDMIKLRKKHNWKIKKEKKLKKNETINTESTFGIFYKDDNGNVIYDEHFIKLKTLLYPLFKDKYKNVNTQMDILNILNPECHIKNNDCKNFNDLMLLHEFKSKRKNILINHYTGSENFDNL